jgi:nicotinamidase-related amidase
MASEEATSVQEQPASIEMAPHMNGGLDPARTAFVLVHMVRGVAGDVDTPFNQLFRRRAEETGIIRTQQRLLGRFRTAKAKVLYTAVTYKQGLPGVRPNSRCGAPSSTVSASWRALPRSRSSTPSPPGPTSRYQRTGGQRV